MPTIICAVCNTELKKNQRCNHWSNVITVETVPKLWIFKKKVIKQTIFCSCGKYLDKNTFSSIIVDTYKDTTHSDIHNFFNVYKCICDNKFIALVGKCCKKKLRKSQLSKEDIDANKRLVECVNMRCQHLPDPKVGITAYKYQELMTKKNQVCRSRCLNCRNTGKVLAASIHTCNNCVQGDIICDVCNDKKTIVISGGKLDCNCIDVKVSKGIPISYESF